MFNVLKITSNNALMKNLLILQSFLTHQMFSLTNYKAPNAKNSAQ